MKLLAGMPGYIAPEIFSKLLKDEKVDIFSFGIIAFYLFIGLRPKFYALEDMHEYLRY